MKKLIPATIFLALLGSIFFYRDRIWASYSQLIRSIKFPFEVMALVKSPPDAELLMPVQGVEVEEIEDTWHDPRQGGRKHEGQDIFAKRGAPVYSATKGYVVRIGTSNLGGNHVYVLSGGGRRYYYAHLDVHAENLERWQMVSTSTVLGYVGNTGNAETTPPHLHLGIYTYEGPMDPLPLLKDR